jgi:ArsR family transcriptional regulator
VQDYIAITKALSDPTRVRALMSLGRGELCVCQLIEVLSLSPSTVSKHMSVLQQAGLVEQRKEGRWRYYRAAGRTAPQIVRDALRWTRRALEGEAEIRSDEETLESVVCRDPSELTCCYEPGAAETRRRAR